MAKELDDGISPEDEEIINKDEIKTVELDRVEVKEINEDAKDPLSDIAPAEETAMVEEKHESTKEVSEEVSEGASEEVDEVGEDSEEIETMESEESYDMKNPLDDEDSEDQDSEDQDESKVKEEVAYENEENGTPSAASDTKKIAILVGIFIVGFALFFFAGKFFSTAEAPISLIDELHEMNELGKESPVNYVYNQYSFVSVEGLWYTKVENRLGGDFDVPVHFGPKDLENLPLQGSINRKFLENPIHITFDPLSDNMQYVALSAAELSTNLANGFQLPIVAACESNQSDACKGRPIVPTCTENKSVIFLRQANYTSVQMKDNCVVIQGRGLELVKATDRFLLQLYGIMA